MSLAFFDDEATASRRPSRSSVATKRSASGKAVIAPAAISASSRRCLRSAYRRTLRLVRGQPQLLQHGARAAEAWLAGDMALIEFGGEARRIGDVPQRVPPGAFVRRVDENAVNVEDDRGERVRRDYVGWHAGALIVRSIGRDQDTVATRSAREAQDPR